MPHTPVRSRNALPALALLVLAACFSPTASSLTLEPEWTEEIDVGSFDLGQDVAIDPEGNVIVTGTSGASGGNDMVTVKLGPSGASLWTQRFHEGDDDRSEGVVADVDGSVYVAGTVKTQLGDDGIVRKYDKNGNHLWTTRIDKGTSESIRSITLAPGHVYVAGTSLSVHGGDGFVAKIAASGSEVWARPVNLYYLDEAFDVAVDDEGGAVVVGRVARDNSFDAMLRRYSASGDEAWTEFINGTDRDELRGVAIDKAGRIFAVGTTQPADGDADILVASFGADGKLAWRKSFDLAGGADEGRDIAVDASGNLLITGFGETAGSKNGFVMKLDPTGKETGWSYRGDDDGIDGMGGIEASSTGLVAVAGARQAGGQDFDYVVSLFQQGALTPGFAAPIGALEAKSALTFKDESRTTGGTLTAWEWDFGDGTTSTEQNPAHAFAWGGKYDVKLKVMDTYGNSGITTRQVQVAGPTQTGAPTEDDSPEESTGGEAAGSSTMAIVGLVALAAAAAVAAGFFLMRRKS